MISGKGAEAGLAYQKEQTHRAFYLFDERTDFEEDCQKIGLKKIVGTQNADEWYFHDEIYVLLKSWECLSTYAFVFMRLPEPSFRDLLEMALNSKNAGEKAASLGIILVKYEGLLKEEINLWGTASKGFQHLIKDIVNLIGKSTARDEFNDLLSVCDNHLNS